MPDKGRSLRTESLESTFAWKSTFPLFSRETNFLVDFPSELTERQVERESILQCVSFSLRFSPHSPRMMCVAMRTTFKNPFIAPAGAVPSAYSEMVSPVFLTQKAAGSLTLALNEGKGLDIEITSRAIIDGYTAPSFKYMQRAVPYSQFSLLIFAIFR